MYSFPYPDSSSLEPLTVPVLANNPIPLNQCFSKLKDGNLAALGVTTIPALIQAWLFFGLASEALGREVGHREFIQQSELDGPSVIDIRIRRWFTAELHERWTKLERDVSPQEFDQLKQKLKKSYDVVVMAVLVFDAMETDTQTDRDLVLLSVHMLLFVVGDMLGFHTTLTSPFLSSTKLLIQRMVSNGWCSKRLNIFTSVKTHFPCLYYLASIIPPQHQRHRDCSEQSCVCSAALLPPLHRTPECLCPNLEPPQAEVNRILAAGGVPLIRMSPSSTGGVNLEVLPYRRGHRFTAISHVWADRQFGSTQNCLPRCQVDHLYSMLKKMPRDEIWRSRKWWFWKNVPPGEVETPVYPYELVWLDTFCVPQGSAHVDLKDTAIQSMNFVYAVATQTLVLDADLQRLDAGHRPASLFHGGRPTFFSPEDDRLLDAVAHVFASTWMSRAWTLQEGMISASCIFQLKGSQAHVKLLKPDFDGTSFDLQDVLEIPYIRQLLFWRTPRDPDLHYYQKYTGSTEPFHYRTQQLLWVLLKHSLDIQDLAQYARGSLARKSKFVTAHRLLQSRSTTQAADLSLILVNLSGLNGNFLAKIRETDERMRLLMYGLGKIPLELLFFPGRRVGNPQTPDRWIPKGISPGIFNDHHTLQLEQSGFRINLAQASSPPKLYILPKSCARKSSYLVSCPSKSGLERTQHLVKTVPSGNGEAAVENVGWCIMLDKGLGLRGAQFLITRTHDRTIYLHYDCPLELTNVEKNHLSQDDRDTLGDFYHATSLERGMDMLLERTDVPQLLDVSRPQTPEQYSDRLIALSGIFCVLLDQLERYLSFGYLEKWCNESTCFMIVYGIFAYKQHAWIEDGLYALVHHAWTATYQPNWDPMGSRKWFWKVMNFEPPVPFKTMMKWYCGWLVTLTILTNQFAALASVCLYWLPLFPIPELLRCICSSLILKTIFWYIYS